MFLLIMTCTYVIIYTYTKCFFNKPVHWNNMQNEVTKTICSAIWPQICWYDSNSMATAHWDRTKFPFKHLDVAKIVHARLWNGDFIFFHVMLFTHCKHRCCKHAGILPSSAMCLPWLKRLHAHGHENTNLSCSIFNIENVWKHCIHGKDAISGCWHIPVKPCWQSQNFNQSQQFQTNDKFPRGTLQETQPWILKHRSPRSQQWDHPHHMQHLKKNTPTKKTEQKVFVGNT